MVLAWAHFQIKAQKWQIKVWGFDVLSGKIWHCLNYPNLVLFSDVKTRFCTWQNKVAMVVEMTICPKENIIFREVFPIAGNSRHNGDHGVTLGLIMALHHLKYCQSSLKIIDTSSRGWPDRWPGTRVAPLSLAMIAHARHVGDRPRVNIKVRIPWGQVMPLQVFGVPAKKHLFEIAFSVQREKSFGYFTGQLK